ncbi:MAG: ribose 5-phosphate isomerase B [Candidatus Cloacimonetes bacterium]|nr:ribose 5-phosphate isomerase B [Candidatus Cloacimonadota bacterium]
MKIALATDHDGLALKERVKVFLSNHRVVDFGPTSTDPMDYPDTGFRAAGAVSRGDCARGILICGSGIGMSIVANKVRGIRAALCTTVQAVQLSRKHNNANILVLSGKFITPELAGNIIYVWLTNEFSRGRHEPRIKKISNYENRSK